LLPSLAHGHIGHPVVLKPFDPKIKTADLEKIQFPDWENPIPDIVSHRKNGGVMLHFNQKNT